MEDNKPIDGAEYISLEDAKRLNAALLRRTGSGISVARR